MSERTVGSEKTSDADALDKDESALRSGIALLPHGLQVIVHLITASLIMFHLIAASTSFIPSLIQRAAHTGLALLLVFILFRAGGGTRPRWFDYLFAAISAAACINFILGYDRIVDLGIMAVPLPRDQLLAACLILVSLEAGRRTIGAFLPILAGIFLVYAYAGPYFPGLLQHRGYSIETILEVSYITPRGLWGMVTAVIASTVAMFIIFGATLTASGAGNAMKNLSLWLGGRVVGGGAYVAVTGSSLFGSISGSTVANVVATGSFTIPMMKRLKYDKAFAGAVEAAASTGGQIMPPVMGSAAFIMAEYLAIPFRDIMIAAMIPAFLYYVGLAFAIRFYAVKHNLPAIPRDQIPNANVVFNMVSVLTLVVPIGVLIFFLLEGLEVSRAVLYALISIAAIILLGGPVQQVFYRLGTLIRALEGGAIALAVITPLALCAQIVVMVVGLTGIGLKMSDAIISLSDGFLGVALGLAAVVTVLLSMGLPTPAAYVVTAAVLAPTLSGLGVPDLSAHMFLFYFAVMSAITPPVCAAVYVAAGIADAPWLRVAGYAVILALPGLVVPFMFVASPELLMDGSAGGVLLATVSGVVGVGALAAASMGYMATRLYHWQRALLFVGAILTLDVGWKSDMTGFSMILLVTTLQYIGGRKRVSLEP